jgi:hypothetical protein
MLEHLKDSTVAYLQVTAETIPEWSGASVATFLHLARAAQYTLSPGPKNSVNSRVAYGLSASEGGWNVKASDGQFTFFYSTILPHLVYNEYNNANENPDATLFSRLLEPGPYGFQDRGRAAFLSVASRVRLPAPKLNIRTITI